MAIFRANRSSPHRSRNLTNASYDVLGIGNAIVDVISRADDAFLAANGLGKGAMTLIDEARAEALYGLMGPGRESSGGSAGNTIAGLASLGGKAAYIGLVRDDQLGNIFRHDIRAAGVAFDTPAAKSGPSTARCLIFVTPDAQRTMQTYLGACVELGPDQVDAARVGAAQITYLEGYLWDKPAAKDAFRKAVEVAHKAGRKVSLTLSDSFCVGRHRAEFRDLVENHVDVLFANEAEILSLYETKNFEEVLPHLRAKPQRIAAVTRSEKGSVAIGNGEVHAVPALAGVKVVDTTGAGDLYAAGFLHGLTTGRDLATCAKLGSICAGEIISHYGARPETGLREFAARHLA
ncbi:MAG: adenosine kinase [Alphaproteobacteria bacterium]|nr:adenosine kinase [Alphaproteobacteria bacterium]